jgi:predicted nucleotidyltransferase
MSNHYRIINRPIAASLEDYQQVFDIIYNELHKSNTIKCIGTFGNINKPGISDIDIIVIFKSGTSYNKNLLSLLPEKLKHLFTHGVMALNEDHYYQNSKYTLWDNFKLFSGELPSKQNNDIDTSSIQAIKSQTALEFMISNYIDLKIQKSYGIIKLRDLLQHTKGLKYDLIYLNIKESKLTNYIDDVQSWISNWFYQIPNDLEIKRWFNQFESDYEEILNNILLNHKLYLPKMNTYNYSKNNKFQYGEKLNFYRSGILMPNFSSLLPDKKYIRLQNRLNKFTFEFPFETENTPQILKERIRFFSEMKEYNNVNYPKFASLITGLISKIV